MATSKKSPTRIYAATRKGHGTMRLVRASTWAGALRHVAKDEYTVDVADQEKLVAAVQRNVPVEVAVAESVEPQPTNLAPGGVLPPLDAGKPVEYATGHSVDNTAPVSLHGDGSGEHLPEFKDGVFRTTGLADTNEA